VAFEGSNRALGSVTAMYVWGYQLIVEVIFGQRTFEFSRGFVVKDIDLRLIAAFGKFFVDV
jgi:hypothetical protein